MKKFILAVILAVVCLSANENSIVGEWESRWIIDYDVAKKYVVICKFDGTGTEIHYTNNRESSKYEFTWEFKNGFVYVYYDESYGDENPREFTYNGGDEFIEGGRTFTRKNPNSISIVGTWVSDTGNDLIFEGNSGYIIDCWGSSQGEICENLYFTYDIDKNGNGTGEFEDGQRISIDYNGNNELTFCEIEPDGSDDGCCIYSRKIESSAINSKQTAQTKNNFQINKNSNSLNLNFTDNSHKKIEIINLQGKMLNSQRFSAKIHNVDISNIPKGVYVLKIFEKGKINSIKFVKE